MNVKRPRVADLVHPIVAENNSSIRIKSAWSRWPVRWLALAVVIIVVGVVASVIQTVLAAVHAERCLHATRLTVRSVEDYVKQHNGDWPRSWKELEQSSAHVKEVYGWTHGSENVQKFVSVQFDADPDVLARQTVEKFEAIKPVSNYYTSWSSVRSEISILLNTLRKARGGRNGTAGCPC